MERPRRRVRHLSLAKQQSEPASVAAANGNASREADSQRPYVYPHRAAVDRAGHHFDINRDDYSGSRLLLADARVGLLLLRDMRYRAVERVLGVPREQSGLVTLIALGMVAQAAQQRLHRMLTMPGRPSVGGAAFGVASAREVLYDMAGPSARETPLFGTLITVAVLGGFAAPVVGTSLRATRKSCVRCGRAFHHRYGHLIGRSRRLSERTVADAIS